MSASTQFWPDKAQAEQWLRSLQPDNTFLYPPISENDQNELETVRIVSISDDHLIVSYPDHDQPNFHRRLFYKDAHTARPHPDDENASINNANTDEESSTTSDSSVLGPQDTIPWPTPSQKPLANVTNGRDTLSFQFTQKSSRKRRSRSGHDDACITGDTRVKKSSSSACRETTPPQAEKTVFNRLHDVRHRSTTDDRISALYADTATSKNVRNRRLKRTSIKTPGDQCKAKQLREHQAKQVEEIKQELEQKEQERKSREHTEQANEADECRMETRRLLRNHGAVGPLGGSGKIFSTESKPTRTTRDDQNKTEEDDDNNDDDEEMRMDGVDDEKESRCNTTTTSHTTTTTSSATTTTTTGMMTRGKRNRLHTQHLLQDTSKPPPWMTRDAQLSRPVGLGNLGNTCFMNSTLQSLIHCTELRSFFLREHENHWWSTQLNTSNPIGYGGKIAMSFAHTLYEYCSESEQRRSRNTYSSSSSVAPYELHRSLSGVLRQFADYRQHDAQEFLTNFLDALHEDLNRIKTKKYLEIPEFDHDAPTPQQLRTFLHTRWHDIYLKRNHSVCTDLFAGLLKSTVTCPTCRYTAITFDPFMHLLLPLKAPRSMQRALDAYRHHPHKHARQHSHPPPQRQYQQPQQKTVVRRRGSRMVMADDDDESTSEEEDENAGDELQIVLLSKDTATAPLKFSVSLSKDIVRGNDWTAFHALCYDQLLQRQTTTTTTTTTTTMMSEQQRVEDCRAAMTRCGEFATDSHVLYFGAQHLDRVKQFEALEPRIPKCMDARKLIEFPMFQLCELAQTDKVLHFREIGAKFANDEIAQYLMDGGCRRLAVQQLPSHWTDADKKAKEENGNIQCYLVFKKPIAPHVITALKTKVRSLYNGFDNVDADDDDDANEIDMNINIDDKERSPSMTAAAEETLESQLEPFSFPRLVFNKGLTAKLSSSQLEQFLTKIATEIVVSVAGSDVVAGTQNEIQIRYTRNAKFDCLQLNTISDWLQVHVKNENSNSGGQAAVRSMVIVCSFGIHQKYSAFQRAEEERIAAMLQRKKDYKRKTRKTTAAADENSGSKKRSFRQAMHGGNSAYESNVCRNGDLDGGGCNGSAVVDENDANPRKRQKIDNGCATADIKSQAATTADHEHDVRDTSLPAEFQPHETMARSIQQCFGMFLSREQLAVDNKWYCHKCKAHVQGKKKLDLWWLPSHLIIAIKRFDNHGLRKYSDHVSYPVEGLDLTDVVRGKQSMDIFYGQHEQQQQQDPKKNKNKNAESTTNEKFIYDLYAVINHSGSLNFGHYTSTIKFGDAWYNISDSYISRVASPKSQQAYILCYKKRLT